MGEPNLDAMAAIAAEVRGCTSCALHEGRICAVPGEGGGAWGHAGATAQTMLGDAPPGWSGLMCVGEAPGRNEDETGRPFCGAAGKRLDEGLAAAGLVRDSVFITSIAKCRPPDNRDPKPAEKDSCTPYLERQIAAMQPKALVALGRHGLSGLVDNPPRTFTQVRGTFMEGRHGVPVWVSLHPAAIIYRQAWREQYLDDWRRIGEWARTGELPPPRTGGEGV